MHTEFYIHKRTTHKRVAVCIIGTTNGKNEKTTKTKLKKNKKK